MGVGYWRYFCGGDEQRSRILANYLQRAGRAGRKSHALLAHLVQTARSAGFANPSGRLRR